MADANATGDAGTGQDRVSATVDAVWDQLDALTGFAAKQPLTALLAAAAAGYALRLVLRPGRR